MFRQSEEQRRSDLQRDIAEDLAEYWRLATPDKDEPERFHFATILLAQLAAAALPVAIRRALTAEQDVTALKARVVDLEVEVRVLRKG